MKNLLSKIIFVHFVLIIFIVTTVKAETIIHRDNFEDYHGVEAGNSVYATQNPYFYFGNEYTGDLYGELSNDLYGPGNVAKINFNVNPFNPPNYTPFASWIMSRPPFMFYPQTKDFSAPNTFVYFDIYSNLTDDLPSTLAIMLIDLDGDIFRIPNSKLATIPKAGRLSRIMFNVNEFTLEDEDTPSGDGVLDLSHILRWSILSLRLDQSIQQLDLPLSSVFIDDITAVTIPEPASLLLLGAGLLVFIKRFRKA